ncbi:ATPase, histidine kinase-, DNA gyrase B-, and HSP90-like domain protein [Synechococcus sp. PCC 7335]|uniref:DICT sensory domain-containing protein n=1 Tax=Synechococcus sp. (strain ATCC 29403 / PCC 7335) TaxID=91464 RepID=UPI00017EE6FE|nr:DICT sensory domain-containing protein [Synechococcus sp. PCC 7335]EDX87888.1 ATPase, histidine kinase-, DNA gyrase B-, and HSP90-like domain protein [Synechococcus sp. PCC 7335]
MGNPASIVEEMFELLPNLRTQMYFKTSLTALSHAMEDQVLAGSEQRPLIIASFQQERFYRQEAQRYVRIGEVSDQVYVLSASDTQFSETAKEQSSDYERIDFDEEDALTQEWHLVVIGEHYSAALICRERQPMLVNPRQLETETGPDQAVSHLDQARRFEGIWTLNRQVSLRAAKLLLDRIQEYRPGLAAKIDQARDRFIPKVLTDALDLDEVEKDPFAQRLITYLQAGQYKQLKAYRAIALQEQRARLVNSITAAIRKSLNPSEIFAIATAELGRVLDVSRCIIYRCAADDPDATIQHEYRQPHINSLEGATWPLKHNPLYQWVKAHHQTLAINDISDPRSESSEVSIDIDLNTAQTRLRRWQIFSCLLVPLIHKNRLLGMVELHLDDKRKHRWSDDEIGLAEAIANQLSVALIQAEAYAHLEDFNQQLADLERTRSNLIAITGHELRTPLSTIRVCLESLITEPDMSADLRQVMLDTALTDAERMRKLVQDFLTLSRLESQRVEWNLESLSLCECVALALSSLRWQNSSNSAPAIQIETDIPDDLPFVRADGEWIVEVLSKLLHNACKFTEGTNQAANGITDNGKVTVSARVRNKHTVEVIVADTGRGIEAERLETVFERFYQEEGALRRSVGGTGLGLAICQQIIEGLKGEIWATSAGKNQGTQIHFTLPAVGQTSRYSTTRRAKEGAAKGSSKITSKSSLKRR